jgi:hypothetical protein
MEATKLALPRSLQLLDANKAALQALIPFGVTPEKMSIMKSTIERGFSTKEKAYAHISGNKSLSTDKGQVVSKQSMDQVQSKPQTFVTMDAMKAKSSTADIKQAKNIPLAGSADLLPPTKISLTKTRTGHVMSDVKSTISTVPSTFNDSSTGIESSNESHTVHSDVFGGMKIMEKSLNIPEIPKEPERESSTPGGGLNYTHILTDFYKTHNPSKISEVPSTLLKYQVRNYMMTYDPKVINYTFLTNISYCVRRATNVHCSRS